METIYIYHHLGMGDHFLCNGILRHYAETHKVISFSKKWSFDNVQYMYRDNPNIVIKAMEDEEVKKFLQFLNAKILLIGHTPEYIRRVDHEKSAKFDEMFYEMAKIPFEFKWSKFHFDRDIESEKRIFYDVLKLRDDEKFIFVHDDPKRNRILKPKYIDKGLKIIRPNEFLDVSIFDFVYTFEKAKEIHVYSSGFSCMLDAMDFTHDNLFYHHYVGFDPKSGLLPHYDHAIKKEKWNFLID